MQQLKIKRALTIKQGNKLMGEFLTEKNYTKLIDFDCDVYDLGTGKILAKFRKNVLSIDKLESAVKSIRKAINISEYRGVAAGKIDINKVRKNVEIQSDFQVKQIRSDGKIVNFKISNRVLSGLMGYMDRSVAVPFCRKTAFTKKYFENHNKAIPFIKEVDLLYSQLCPVEHDVQKKFSNACDVNYLINDTSFTTITINKDFQTAVHKDSGDLIDGIGNLTCYKTPGLKGAYFVLPEWAVAFDVCNTDLLLCDVHQWHGNTPLIKENNTDERISFVMYFRENMIKCKKPTDELKRVKNNPYPIHK